MTPSSSLIISTYNWPEALNLVLLSVMRQVYKPVEILIADDGSTSDTAELIETFKDKFNMPLHHIWQPDRGFQASKIRNMAIKAAVGDYIIQIDGDVILHPYFIADHVRMARSGVFLSGSRALLSANTTNNAIKHKTTQFDLSTVGMKNKVNTLYLPWISPFLTKPISEPRKILESIRGCNMSYWREDVMAVNGYDTDFTTWGREDSELAVRLINSGLIHHRLKLCAIQYHLHHEYRSRSGMPENDQRMYDSVSKGLVRCESGIDQLD